MTTFVLIIWMADGFIDLSGKFPSREECIDWGQWKVESLSKWPDKKILGWKCQEQ